MTNAGISTSCTAIPGMALSSAPARKALQVKGLPLLPRSAAGISLSLLCAMILGRIVWGCAVVVILGVGGTPFTWSAFLAGALLNAIPGIAVQLVLIPALVVALQRANII